ncbi:MAG: exodeoxyribonuclease VII large subunit [Porticoccus sp.]|jgi:exodeoxyribonuclease VII large subunit
MENKAMEKPSATYTVSQLNRRARQLLEAQFPLIWVEGEISNLSKPGSGHWYFTLKDEVAQISCAMFRSQNSKSRFMPDNGAKALARCRVSIYEGRGDFQLIIEHIEEAGFGALQRQFNELKERLLQQGMFDKKHKQTLPAYPKRIGIITSPTGAAVRDILSVLKRRYPATRVTIYPSIVQGRNSQGNSAAYELANRIICANTDKTCDVLVLSRGGGSLEDLWAFNEEILAQAIYDSGIPIISAVGHETDSTIADFVADYRAETPSAAAVIVSPDASALILGLERKEENLKEIIFRHLQAKGQHVDGLYRRIRNPVDFLLYIKSQLTNLELRLQQSAAVKFRNYSIVLRNLDEKVTRSHPSSQLSSLRGKTELLEQQLKKGILALLSQKQQEWENTARLLHTISPLNTLQRGYAIVLDKQEKVLQHIANIGVGDQVSTRLIDGILLSTIDEIIPEKNNDA